MKKCFWDLRGWLGSGSAPGGTDMVQSEQAEGRCVAGRWIRVDHVIPESQPRSSPPNYQNSGRVKQSPDPFRILILSRSLCSYASKSASKTPPQSPLEKQRTEAERSTGHTSRARPKHAVPGSVRLEQQRRGPLVFLCSVIIPKALFHTIFFLIPIFTDGKTEAQQSQMTRSRSQS